MKNIKTLQLAAKLMEAHNDLNGYKTFKAVSVMERNEQLLFNCDFQFLSEAFRIAEILNLSIGETGLNSHPYKLT